MLEVLTEAEAGLFYNSADLDTLAAVVHRIVGDPELLSRNRGNALRFARDRFNWQVQAETLYALYRSTADAAENAPSGVVVQTATYPEGAAPRACGQSS